MDTTKLATATKIALGFGNRKDLIEVTDLAHASATYRAAVVASGRGYSTTPQGWIYDLAPATPKRVARVSYNGRVWTIKDDALLFDPSAAVAP